MHLERHEPRAALRATLLLGVAGTAAAVSSAALADQAAAPPADPQKWSPYSSIEGSAGSGMVAGKLDLFVPVFQNMDSLVFLNLGVGTETKAHALFNAGLGYRTEIYSQWIVGAYVNHDSTQLNDNNTFGQTALGAELMSADWDVRLNGYLADNRPAPIAGDYGLFISGTTIGILQGQDAGYSGFDGEVGYRVFSDDNTDVRVFIGGFHFSHDNTSTMSMGSGFDFGYRDLTGPKARAEATVYDLDVLGNQSRVTLEGEIAHDDVRGTTGSVSATLRIALGNFSGGGGAQALDELDRRMVDPERRNDTVLTRAQMTKPEPVIIYGPGVKSNPTNTLLYVDNTLGAGTYANPTTFADAASRQNSNAFIVLTSKQGPITGGATLQPGQTVVAGGNTFTVEGEFSHTKFTHLFDPSTNVTVTPATAGGNVITLASNTSLYGFAIKGDFGNAIYGKNVDHVSISHVAIDGTGGGETGVNIQHTVSGEEIVNIDNTTVSNVTGDGIFLRSDITDGGTSTETFTLNNISVTNAGNAGIDISDYAGKGSTIASNIALSNVSVTGANYGIGVYANGYGTGSTVNQTVTIANATVSNAVYSGIEVGAYAGYGATVSQSATISAATISHLGSTNYGGFGIDLLASSYGAGSTVTQTAIVSGVTESYFYGNRATGIYVRASAEAGATTTQTATLSNVTFSDKMNFPVSTYGIRVSAGAYGYGATVTQAATITGANVSYVYGAAFEIEADAQGAAHIVQTATLTNVTGTNSYTGLGITAEALDNNNTTPTTIDQTVSVTGSTFANDYYGAVIRNRAVPVTYGNPSMSASSQSVNFSNTTLSGNGVGLYLEERAAFGAAANQYVTLNGVNVEHNAYVGAVMVAEAAYQGFAKQHVTFDDPNGYNEISYNGGDGILAAAFAAAAGAVDQHLYVYHSHVDHNAGNGVAIETEALGYAVNHSQIYYSHVQQNVIFAYGTISNNGANGVSVSNSVTYAPQVDQIIELYRESVDHNAGNGFLETSTMTTYRGYGFAANTVLHSDVYLQNSDFSYNGGSGISITSHLNSPTTYIPAGIAYSYLEQHITAAYVTANHNAVNGFTAAAYDKGVFGLNIQYVTLQGSQFAYNNDHGAELIAHQVFGPLGFGAAEQIVTLQGSQFSHNGKNGLYAYAYAGGNQGRAEQHFTVQGSYFDNNGANGIDLKRIAENGVYVSGFPCTAVQGLSGGCAFVRQTFDMVDGSANHNGGYGINISGYADKYGALYSESGRPAHVPNVYLKSVQVDTNAVGGFYSDVVVKNHSYAYNYIVAIGSTFDHNATFGFKTNTYAGGYSTIVERNALFSYKGVNSASYDLPDGVALASDAANHSQLLSTNIIYGLTAEHNDGEGVRIGAQYIDGTSFVHQYNYIGASNLSFNHADGLGLYAAGPGVGAAPGAGQYNRIGNANYATGNIITNNGRNGIYGAAVDGGYQLINVYTQGNSVTSNAGGNYRFITAIGGFQHIY